MTESASDHQAITNMVFTRPWGYYKILEKTNQHQVKRIVVNPNQRLSLQSHHHRQEKWIIIKGQGIAIIGDASIAVNVGDYVAIDKEMKHRISCTSDCPLEFIEVQLGDYLEEDDIIRYEDDYNRQ